MWARARAIEPFYRTDIVTKSDFFFRINAKVAEREKKKEEKQHTRQQIHNDSNNKNNANFLVIRIWLMFVLWTMMKVCVFVFALLKWM